MTKLSFVIPAYNEEEYLGGCLESIRQEITNLPPDVKKSLDVEVVVVNNASIDNTRQVASSFSEVKIVDEINKGLVKARQAGFLAVSGDLIANIDSDTRLASGWISHVFENFKDQELMGLSGPERFYDMPTHFNLGTYLFYWIAVTIIFVARLFTHKAGLFQGGNYIIRRSALEKAGGFNVDNFDFYGEDTDIACRIAAIGKTKFDFKLLMYASGRRFKKEGYTKVLTNYALNYFSTIIWGLPVTKENTDHRGDKLAHVTR